MSECYLSLYSDVFPVETGSLGGTCRGCQWKCSIDLTQLVIGWPKATANTASDPLAVNKLLTALMMPIVLKEIKALTTREPGDQC